VQVINNSCGCIRLVRPQMTEWQRIGNQIDAAAAGSTLSMVLGLWFVIQ
jgi:hypothetical protein